MIRVRHAVLMLVLAACNSAADPGNNPAGTYNLQQVNDDDLPTLLEQRPNYTREVLIGYLRIDEEGTFLRSLTSRVVEGPTTTTTTSQTRGTWTREGSDLALQIAGVKTLASMIDRNLIVVFDSVKYDYRR